MDIIGFNIPGAGPHTIQPASPLPEINDPVTIDSTTEPDFSGTPIIELDGTNAGTADGLFITAGSSTVRGLVINKFNGHGILLQLNGGNTIEGNYIGLDVDGATDAGNAQAGVEISDASSGNTIGGTTASARNVLSGNGFDGIRIIGDFADDNVIQGNYISTDFEGDTAVLNGFYGVAIFNGGPANNTIGGVTAEERNIISGNGIDGVGIFDNATGTLVQGNYIGTDVNGTTALPNSSDGVFITDSATDNTIGGTAVGAGNLISGNTNNGVYIKEAAGNFVRGNFIGTDVDGTGSLANGDDGVLTEGASNTVGGTEDGAGNLISSNGSDGIEIRATIVPTVRMQAADKAEPSDRSLRRSPPVSNSAARATSTALRQPRQKTSRQSARVVPNSTAQTGSFVQGNYIGTDVNGTAELGNTNNGVYINGVPNNLVGGTDADDGTVDGNVKARNLISGNGRSRAMSTASALGACEASS